MQEAPATKAHEAGYGEKRDRFATAASCANSNPGLFNKVTSKSISDWYKKLHDAFDRGSPATWRTSGVGGELGESTELLSEMGEAGKDLGERVRGDSAANRAREEEQERIGRMVVSMAMHRRGAMGEAGNDCLESGFRGP